MKTLNQTLLSTLPSSVDKPEYDRSQVKAGIVHIGVGGFHRAHQAMYTNELLKQPGNENWGICGVGLLEANRKLSEVLKKQDYLYTLLVRHSNGKIDTKIIGSMVDFIFAPANKQAVIDKLISDDTRIVSLTVTEGGYNQDSETGELDIKHADIQHDINYPDDPKTFYGYITAALKARRAMGKKAFTVQSCDNIQHNGSVTKSLLLTFIAQSDVELAEWVKNNVAFPNAMVDRITPVTTPADIDAVEKLLGYQDEWPITCESFSQWVIEDEFSDGRPNWDAVSAQFVPDVTPYETMKIRLLNAGHSVLGLLGSIHGYQTIDETVSDPLFAKYLRAFMDEEVTPVLAPVEGIDLEEYKDALLARFANPNIKDALSRICSETSAKLPKFLISTINENLAEGRSAKLSTLVVAAWCYYSDKQTSENGEALTIIDAMQDKLHHAAQGTVTDSLSFLKVKTVFGNLSDKPNFTETYQQAIKDLYLSDDKIKTIMQNWLAK
ncbi:mannitol dehydrogenase family protein [Gayadomonas joobiniege]|uniref:mannitol dehydrogenase family protein n=1 Tax=Gayadomonas joobiniege TaxID=1234606 RepID=UPI0003796FEB|nr:mannitol dehydrogenase family protein [Gayadomonas joobiniege]